MQIKFEKQHLFFRHYWMDKKKIKKSENGFVFKEESDALENLIKTKKVINWNLL